jgi:hypothetical protein
MYYKYLFSSLGVIARRRDDAFSQEATGVCQNVHLRMLVVMQVYDY